MCRWNNVVMRPELTPRVARGKDHEQGRDEAEVIDQEKANGISLAVHAGQVAEEREVHLARAGELEQGNEKTEHERAPDERCRAHVGPHRGMDLSLQRLRELQQHLGGTSRLMRVKS